MIALVVFFSVGMSLSFAQNARLPGTLAPTKYFLELSANVDQSTFTGKITIMITCQKTTREIVLHSKELNISQNEVTFHLVENNQPTRKIAIQSPSFDEPNDFFKFSVDEDLIENSLYQLFIPYDGALRDDSQGFFKNTFTDETGKSKVMALTYLFPNNARLVMPCFDEPVYKATFTISLTHAAQLVVASNMMALSGGSSDNIATDSFEESPALSTYVIAFMFFELEIIQFIEDNMYMNIYVRKQFRNQVAFAHNVSMKALAFFGSYFEFPYPSRKLDIGVIPGFPISGVENFGLINVSESPILLNEDTASIFNKYDSASIVCTEIANQWLGDIVTNAWWEDSWLFSAFGDYFSIIAVENTKVITESGIADLEFLRKFQNTIEADGSATSHPIVVPIEDPKDTNISDPLIFEKGPYLIRMTNLMLNEDNFKTSIATFIKKHQFATATRDDLWSIMTEIAHTNNVIPNDVAVKDIMDSWLTQAGYPFLRVKIDYSNNKVSISQERFFSDLDLTSQNGGANPNPPCWRLPLSFTTNKEFKFETAAKKWFMCKDLNPLEIPLDPFDITENDWIIFNIRMQVPIQILYEEKNWLAIMNTLKQEKEFGKIEVLSRVQVILDAFSFSWTAELSYKFVFDLVQYLKFENEYLPWRVTLRKFADLRYLLLRTEIYGAFQKAVNALVEPKFKAFGPITELSATDYIYTHFKTFVTFWACSNYIQDCQAQSVKIFEDWMGSTNPDQTNPVPSDLRETVYCQGAQVKDEKYWNFLYDRYKNSKEPTELSKISAALACSLDPKILQKYLEWSLIESNIRREESVWVFSSVCDNDIAFDLVKNFLQNRFVDIYNYHNGNPDTLTTYFTSFTSLIIRDTELTEFQAFWEKEKSKLDKVNLDEVIAKARTNIAWQNIHYEEMKKLLVP